ncbi:hypothetical protein BGX27_007571 [Mortierella sp. AM989]|nr:hypothetical protein BGX27_007571 [Mortierella sp. AM989]
MKSGPFGFGPYHRQITWTSRYYLRYHTVIDLEKLCTRKRSNLDGTFQELFSPYRWSSMNSIGILDYLQRALLNQPGADRIQSLRIPIHRMRTFQQRHERAPRNRKKSRTEEGRNRRETQAANHSLEKGGPEITPQADGVEDSGNKSGNNINPPIFSSVTDESQRPYCFTFNKLTNLRRLDVFWMTDNQCDWEALDRVLATLLFGNHRGIAGAIEGKDNGERKENYQLLNQIREFSLHTQSALGAPFHKILNYFEHLEVLELQSDSYQHNPWVSHWNPALCRDLKVLRMGTSALWNGTSTAFEDLGRLESLEELRITINNPLHFQWVVDAKMKLARCGRKESINPNSSQPGYSIAPGNKTTTYVNINESYPLSNCLPNLKKLGCTLTGNRCQLSLRNITEAFSDQLEEFVLRSNYRNNAIHRIEHPFRHLCRLAIRGDILLRFDFASLAQNCPTVELLAIQHSCYTRVIADILEKNAAVAALVSLKKLRCLYLEGTWYFNSEQFLRLAQESVSLYKIAFYRCDSITSTALKMADEILSCRHSKYPLKPKGVFRLPSTMSDVLARDISWRTTFFGHDDD